MKNNQMNSKDAGCFSLQNVNLVVYIFISIFFFLAAYDFYQGFILIGNPPSLASKRFVVFCIVSLIPLAAWVYGLTLAYHGNLGRKLEKVEKQAISRIPFYGRVILAILSLLFPTILFLYSPFGNFSFIYWLRLFTLLGFSVLAALFLFNEDITIQWLLKASGMVLFSTVIFIIGDWLTGVSDYPFSLAWSEGNRFWDYSIMFGMSRYINPSGKTIVPFLEAGRQLLWAIPFIFPSIGIWGMRLWNVIVWVIPPLVLGFITVFQKSTFKKEWVWQIGFALWLFVFLSQGPIYPPLIICAILVVIGLKNRGILVPALFIAVASYYARISRWTWMYAPGLWAGLQALLEIQNPSFIKNRWRELIRPVVLGLSGLVGAELVARMISMFSKGQIATEGSVTSVVVSSFDFAQPMLWDRLFPNPTYAPGILLGYVWVGGPLLLFMAYMIIKRIWKTNWMQNASLLIVLGAFSLIGIIISVKIGGGSNLHNLDLLWVTLTLIVGWFFRNWLDAGLPGLRESKIVLAVTCFAIVMPMTTMIQYGEPFSKPADYFVTSSLAKLQAEVAAAKTKGEVLFMDQRQLLTFGYVKDVPLVAEYEKKLVMDQAMSGNAAYFAEFYKDLQNHRFSLIVSEPLRKSMADEDIRNFAEENNSWVYWVSRPLLKYYKPKVTYDEVGVQLLIPREN